MLRPTRRLLGSSNEAERVYGDCMCHCPMKCVNENKINNRGSLSRLVYKSACKYINEFR